MPRVLVVAHSARARDSTLWKELLARYPSVDVVVPQLRSEHSGKSDLDFLDGPRVFPKRAVEPFGAGHSSMWIRGLLNRSLLKEYDLVHAAFEPWSLIPQALCGRVPTVVHGAESVLRDAPRLSKMRRVGTRRTLSKVAGALTWGQTALDAFHDMGLPTSTPQGVIPLGIPDPVIFRLRPIVNLRGPLKILYIGRLVPEKGIMTLIKAAQEIGQPLLVRVLGEGPLFDSMQSFAAHNDTNWLSIEGAANIDEVADALAWSHVVVVPSESTKTWMEQWGRVAVEAMLSGRTTVVSDSGELPHLGVNPELIFPAGDVAALAGILIKLERNRQLIMSYGISLRESASRFSPHKMATELYNFWEIVVDQ